MSLLKIEDVSVVYGSYSNKVTALKNVSLEINSGEFIAVTGRSGCGKTTLLNVLGGILKPSQGSYIFDGQNVYLKKDKELAKFRNQNVSFIVQHFALIPDRTVRDNVALPLLFRHSGRREIKEKVFAALEQLGISDKMYSYPYELSGGECQRAAIARALVADSKLLIADEPTGALDEANGYKIIEIMHSLNREGKTIIMVTHDLELAKEGTSMICMRDGEIRDK